MQFNYNSMAQIRDTDIPGYPGRVATLRKAGEVRVTEALPLWSIYCRVLAYIALSIDGISRNTQVTYSEVKEMWETLFVCKPVCQWLDIRLIRVLQNLDNTDLLKAEIAYNTSIFTAVTRNHSNDQKSRYTAKITVITVIVNFVIFLQP